MEKNKKENNEEKYEDIPIEEVEGVFHDLDLGENTKEKKDDTNTDKTKI